MPVYESTHLLKERQIQLGSYYTPESLVEKVYELIEPYTGNGVIIFDNAAGFGAFVVKAKAQECDYRAAECDLGAYNFLKENLDEKKVFYTNSLINVSREKYHIPNGAFVIQVGNPPYNDTTSEFKNGQKGQNVCDNDLADRDLGISFLKSYNKLKANLVCVLHPLSYLIKEANFKRLKDFRYNYKLIKGEIFSSSWFSGTGSLKFPIVIALYERDAGGMSFDYIRNFEFNILDSKAIFKLARYETTDGCIDKYPPRKDGRKTSPIWLYYYTFRDINSLKKNSSFMNKQHYNGIIVTVENLYKYAYLNAFKELFSAQDMWLYGNLSPLINREELEKNKKSYIEYAIQTNLVIKTSNKAILQEIAEYYEINLNNLTNIETLEKKIQNQLNTLIL